MERLYVIRVKFSDMKKACLMSGSGHLINRKVHAAQMSYPEADRVATEIRKNFPGAVVKVGDL